MFNLSFYVICWLLFFLLCLPIIFAGLFAVALDEEGTGVAVNHLQRISNDLNTFANDKAKLKALLEDFKNSYKSCPKDEEDYNLWLDVISRFATNMNLMEVDEVVDFQDKLESANPDSKASIKEVIGKALQKRESK
ncbi:MAG: hypothetical protein J1E28_02080 [Helicobacter sp.]|uniref:hypothetical protein n=1 Tax=Helicobacter sp. TaxID=218 RepID=UPI0025C02ABE|nr:hypothetical protein [Helicobacter sp.]MCH5313177.1 hypothetical protein [Helicobacter sp.]